MMKWLIVVQHEVTPTGILRFAITSRSIYPKEENRSKKTALPADGTPSAETALFVKATPSDDADILSPNVKMLAYKGDL